MTFVYICILYKLKPKRQNIEIKINYKVLSVAYHYNSLYWNNV